MCNRYLAFYVQHESALNFDSRIWKLGPLVISSMNRWTESPRRWMNPPPSCNISWYAPKKGDLCVVTFENSSKAVNLLLSCFQNEGRHVFVVLPKAWSQFFDLFVHASSNLMSVMLFIQGDLQFAIWKVKVIVETTHC